MGEAKKTLFEMVCTANHGRSPVAELVGRIYLVDRGVSGAYDTISSGSLADAIKARKVSPAARDRFVKLAMERGDVLTSGEVSAYQKAEKVGDHMKMDELYWKVAERFQHEEHEHRSEAMDYFSLDGSKLKQGSDQTVVRPDVAVILCMAEPNTKQVEAIYEGAHHAPHIETLGIGDAFGRSKDAYFRAVEQILEKVPAAIERQLFGDL